MPSPPNKMEAALSEMERELDDIVDQKKKEGIQKKESASKLVDDF